MRLLPFSWYHWFFFLLTFTFLFDSFYLEILVWRSGFLVALFLLCFCICDFDFILFWSSRSRCSRDVCFFFLLQNVLSVCFGVLICCFLLSQSCHSVLLLVDRLIDGCVSRLLKSLFLEIFSRSLWTWAKKIGQNTQPFVYGSKCKNSSMIFDA